MRYACKQNVFVTDLAESLALLDMQTGTYYTLNNTGALVWTEISNGVELDEIANTISLKYDCSPSVARQDVLALVNDLIVNGLVTSNDDHRQT